MKPVVVPSESGLLDERACGFRLAGGRTVTGCIGAGEDGVERAWLSEDMRSGCYTDNVVMVRAERLVLPCAGIIAADLCLPPGG